MAEDLLENSIELLSRALLAQLAPITGARAGGLVRVTATAAGVTIPANTYLLPIDRGELLDELPFKTTEDVTLGAAGSFADVRITSNIGGARHNRTSGTVFRFDPPIEGVSPSAVAVAGITGGSNVGALIAAAHLFEDIDAGNSSEDLFAAMVGHTPAVVLSWLTTDPVEGVSGGLRRGSTRAGRGISILRESFALYIIADRLRSTGARRQSGQLIMQAVTRLLSNRMQNDDGEQLATVDGGVEIENRARIIRKPEHYVYGIRLRTTQTSEVRPAAREFTPWELTRIRAAAPGREAPEPTERLTLADVSDPMPGHEEP